MKTLRAPIAAALALALLTFASHLVVARERPRPSRAARAVAAAKRFANPLLPAGADPWSVYKDGFYYYMHTTGNNLTIWKTRSIADLRKAEKRVVWTPPASGPYSNDIWAPELHFLDGRWYIYFAADAGTNETHRIWVLENASADPLSAEWEMKGKLAAATDKWAIDCSVFDHAGRRYAVWSGWEGDVNGAQNIYIARMSNPWTIEGDRALISAPTYPWEKVGDLNSPGNPPHVDVNEGPEALERGDKLFLVYSASGCWTDQYALGMLTASASSDPLDPASWTKSPTPVFRSAPRSHAYATGHNSFFKSPDGTEDWILYHANSGPGQGCGGLRSPRAQPFTWRADGTPDFGRPVPVGKRIRRPSGE
jgi:GH43 family beta-xylosidase